MAMRFRYGGYLHPDSEVNVRSISKNLVLGANGRPHYIDNIWNLEGKIVSSDGTAAAVWSTYSSMVLAYKQEASSAGFEGTPIYISAASCFGQPGIIATSPIAHGSLTGAGLGCTFLKYSMTIQFSTPFAEGGTILDFTETTTFTDNNGLPMTVERIPQNGLPIIQQTSESSFFYATQSGSMTQAFTQPIPPAPLFPTCLRTSSGQARNYTYDSPRQMRGKYLSYSCKWNFQFVSIVPIFSYPNVIS